MTRHGIEISQEKLAEFCRRNHIRVLSLFGSIQMAGKTGELGRAVIKNIKPIMEALHRRYPKLKISAGIHNTGFF